MIIFKAGLPTLIAAVIYLTVATKSKLHCEECESAIHGAVDFRCGQDKSGDIKGHISDLKGFIWMKFFMAEQHINMSGSNLML
jgi:hypothetical protein